MYSDLFDALGGASGSNPSSSSRPEVEPLVSFKAGKCELALQENGKYSVIPDTRRGQVNLKYNDDSDLVWEWFDRREKTVVDTLTLKEPTKLEKAALPPKASESDKVYYWKLENEWKMVWLQDKEEDPALIDKVNEILKKPKKPTEAATGVSAPSPGNASTSSSSTARQVDALSNILENLGMPQEAQAAAAATAASAASATATTSSDGAPAVAGGGTLTLADLQGVMAGLQQQQQPQGPPPGLSDIVTPEAITDLLANEEVRNRLMQELPEEQRSMQYLEENLRSPQVQQTLRSLTAALLPDDNGSMEGYHSVLANFQLDAQAGQAALTETNDPIQAFLDCVLASVQKEQEEETKDEEMKE
jgi:26S proteasome regulatory subunit N13